ncbi:hypothetical protein JCM16303_003814 [Sporobolomyces ruberrimus]
MSFPPLETLALSDTRTLHHPQACLTTLPPELFDHILSLVYGSEYTPQRPSGPYLGVLSRAFLHHARKHHFGKVRIAHPKALRLLLYAIANSPETAEYVLQAELDFTTPPVDDYEGLPDEDLLILLSDLVCLKRLEVRKFQRFSKLIANPPSSIQPLPALTSLSLDDNFVDWRNAFDPRHWTSLDRYPSLSRFNLSHKSLPGFDEYEGRQQRFPPPQPNPTIEFIHLVGYFRDNSALSAFFDFFPNAHCVTFSEISDSPEGVVDFLFSITQPERIRHLSVPMLPNLEPGFPSALQRFQKLRSLSLGPGTWRTAEVTDVLLALPELNTFNLADDADDPEVMRFVVNAPSLSRLEFTNPFYPGNLGRPLELEDQYELGWTETYTPEGVIRAARAASKRGILTAGPALEMAVEIYKMKRRRAQWIKELVERNRRPTESEESD